MATKPAPVRSAACSEFFVMSIRHTKRTDPYITLWRPNCAGYAWPLSWAGRYTEADDLKSPMYLHRGDDTVMVRADVAESLAVNPSKGRIDGDAGPVLPNNSRTWKRLLSAMIRPPRDKPRPQYRGAPRDTQNAELSREGGEKKL